MTVRIPGVADEAAEIATRLRDAGLEDAANAVERASRISKTDPALAESILREAADDLMARSPAYSRWRAGR
jgi:hypothetical protein